MKRDGLYNNIKINSYSTILPEAKERAAKIFSALDGAPINAAISLLEWCSFELLCQKCDGNAITQYIYQEPHE